MANDEKLQVKVDIHQICNIFSNLLGMSWVALEIAEKKILKRRFIGESVFGSHDDETILKAINQIRMEINKLRKMENENKNN